MGGNQGLEVEVAPLTITTYDSLRWFVPPVPCNSRLCRVTKWVILSQWDKAGVPPGHLGLPVSLQ